MDPTSFLFLGSGDFSAPLEVSRDHSDWDAGNARAFGLHPPKDENDPRARKLRTGITIWATELLSMDAAIAQYQAIDKRQHTQEKERYEFNCLALKMQNCVVRWEFDATRFPTNAPSFDKIIFENPHTGVYGRVGDGVQDMRCVVSNTAFLQNVMNQVSTHLHHHGIFELHVCGWPYLPRPQSKEKWDEGLQLGQEEKAREFATKAGLRFVRYEDRGKRSISRNNGAKFEAEVTCLIFTKP